MKSFHIKILSICIIICIYTIYNQYINTTCRQVTFNLTNPVKNRSLDMKYILQWTSDKTIPFAHMGQGQEGFLRRNCTYVNCFVTSDKELLKSVTKFDVVLFSGPELSDSLTLNSTFPVTRSAHQKYVFASIESADNYGMYTDLVDGFFNWTWTYKLDSDLRWGYIVVKDLQNNVIGPKIDMNWLKIEEMDPVTEDFRLKLRKKRKIAAWIVSNCFATSRRESFFENLQNELTHVHNHSIDVYGKCGLHVCKEQEICDKRISDDYYFYLSFENSFSEDYVTEKLLLALNNNAVPIVYGGANYTRFMPYGIYLDAIDLGVKKLAAKMIELVNDPEKYANYFKWKNHYKYERTTDSPETDEYCSMCALVNDDEAIKKQTTYWNFQDWWNTKTKIDLSKLLFQKDFNNNFVSYWQCANCAK